MHFIRELRSAIRRALAVIGKETKRISKTYKSSCRTRIHNYICTPLGRLAQLVQSTCLTSRGSGVRIPQRPQPKSKKAIHESGWLSCFGAIEACFKKRSKEKSQTLRDSGRLSYCFGWVPGHQCRVLSSGARKIPGEYSY